ncbi:helicase-related protein [Palleronia sp. KMU-117]|uniref:helicase-related protein n=1 Tax=Palleronia sp. KMU-117 TaxID=3434108 RepID=UPI003D7544C9
MSERFEAGPALRSLKAFQLATVDYVSRRLLSDPDRVRHFLVADEVGLGKTMVARGVIARTIEALQDKIPRIDVIYICSNGAIAKQNVARLNVFGGTRTRVLPTRLTMLAVELARAGGIRETGVNFFSLTPGTSLDLKQGGGMKVERALILRLLWDLLDDRRAVARMLRGYAGKEGWRAARVWVNAQELEPQIVDRFRRAAEARPELLNELEECAQAYKGLRGNDTALNRKRERIVGEFRTILARQSAEALEPDLIVLDEFQRFTDVLHGGGEAAELAARLFNATDPEGNQARVLLLSATPYRMLSLRDDSEDAGDHYKEFLDVLGFLFGPGRGETVRQELEQEMRRFRSALLGLPSDYREARTIKDGIEHTLRKVIARTERVSETAERDAMMRDAKIEVTVAPDDLVEARSIARIAAAADAPETIEYWKSAPYLLSFLRDYKLGQRLEERKDFPSEALIAAIRQAGSAQIDVDAVEAYRPIPVNNGRMRALMDIASRDDMQRRLWMPPSLPYFGRRVAASKLLVFSQWTMVPDAIAALLSYESERKMGMAARWSTYSATHSQRLNFRRDKERLSGLRVLPLVVPSPTLAAAADPLEIFGGEPALPDAAAMRDAVRRRLVPVAEQLISRIAPLHRGSPPDRNSDEAGEEGEAAATWDWAGVAALDMRNTSFASWLGRGGLLADVVREDGQNAWFEHLDALRETAKAETLRGTPSQELVLDHLTDLALGSPATCALRALSRLFPDLRLDNPEMLDAAARVGMAFRSLFNQPESQALLRAETDEFYWKSVLRHCSEQDLQSVLDEYVHVLIEAEGLSTEAPAEALIALAQKMDEALSLKPAQIEIKSYAVRGESLEIQRRLTMRGRFATRLLQKVGEDREVQRTDTVRTAFNSPFRPFVLATTSIGQEGLDFHHWCHRLVHWNLPGNPVDLEQREGRVHRFKNHAVRLNLASRFSASLRGARGNADPWAIMFDAAHREAKRPGDMEPFWLLDGDTKIERYALSLPFSREATLLARLKRSVAIYRLAFGQPRQDDLLAFLEATNEDVGGLDLAALQISLRPPPMPQISKNPGNVAHIDLSDDDPALSSQKPAPAITSIGTSHSSSFADALNERRE